MKKKYEYLNDTAFLEDLAKNRLKEQFTKIIVLTQDEKPEEEITGKVFSGGSISLDGKSAIRRTCNLTMLASIKNDRLTDLDNLLSINRKVKIESGYVNNLKTEYPRYAHYDMFWIPLGVYVIQNPSITNDSNGVKISLQLKDKMCLLNGENGGKFTGPIVFDVAETDMFEPQIDGTYKAVTVTDKIPIFQIIQELVHHFGGEQLGKIIINDIALEVRQPYVVRDEKILSLITKNAGELELVGTEVSSAIQYKSMEPVGYISTPFVYDGVARSLSANAGDNICTILDKIKNRLGNYEYFYDLDGNFVFQEIKNYLNTSQATDILEQVRAGNNSVYNLDRSRGKSVFSFNDGTLISSYSNSPQYNLVKNDFIVWGKKGNSSIRYHLAIDTKPQTGNRHSYFIYDFEDTDTKVVEQRIKSLIEGPLPDTGTIGFYYKDGTKIKTWTGTEFIEVAGDIIDAETTDWRTELFLQGVEADNLALESNDYYAELKNEWPKVYDMINGEYYDIPDTEITYFLDFIDSANSSLSKMSISAIGRRTETLTDETNINCVFEPIVPEFYIIPYADSIEDASEKATAAELLGYKPVYIKQDLFDSSLQAMTSYNSAFNAARNMLYQYISYNETITLNAIPLPFLQPNTRVTVQDAKSGISGDYMINSISLPLEDNGLMNLNCTRVLDRI